MARAEIDPETYPEVASGKRRGAGRQEKRRNRQEKPLPETMPSRLLFHYDPPPDGGMT
jgi:hypothetical protein